MGGLSQRPVHTDGFWPVALGTRQQVSDHFGHKLEAVAAKRRALPLGGGVPEDYILERTGETCMPEKVKMSELFGPHDAVIFIASCTGQSARCRVQVALTC
jgi:predicted dithiol-disulfide oxidoreductase (DUF899 family)